LYRTHLDWRIQSESKNPRANCCQPNDWQASAVVELQQVWGSLCASSCTRLIVQNNWRGPPVAYFSKPSSTRSTRYNFYKQQWRLCLSPPHHLRKRLHNNIEDWEV